MNRKIKAIMILLLLPLCVARAEDALQVIPFATTAGVEEGSDETFSIAMVNTQSYTAMEFNLYLPEGMTLIMESDDYDPMELSSDRFPGKIKKGVFFPNHDTDIKLMSDGRYYIKIYNTDLETISGTEGELLIFYYETATDMEDGYYPITITGAILGVDSHTGVYPVNSTSFVKIGNPEKFDASILEGYIPSFVASAIPADEAAYDFSNVDEMGATFIPANPNAVQYVKAESAYAATATGNVVTDGVCKNLVITDGYPFAAPTAFTATRASYERILSNDWGTICLPYAIQSDETMQLYQLQEVVDNKFIFGQVDVLAAGEPGVFNRLGAGNLTWEAENANISVGVAEGVETSGMKIIGTLDERRVDVDNNAPSYYIKNNAFCKGTGYFTVPAFRSYFQSETANDTRVFLIAVEDATTGVQMIDGGMVTDGEVIYDLNGLPVSGSTINGIFIRDGKKYIHP